MAVKGRLLIRSFIHAVLFIPYIKLSERKKKRSKALGAKLWLPSVEANPKKGENSFSPFHIHQAKFGP